MSRSRSSDGPALTGLLVIDKPAGWTSHDVVARLRRITGVRRIGHAGTLDPFATGVLPVAVGRATRLLQYVQAHDKHYLTVVVLGVETDSGDLAGAPVGNPHDAPWPEAATVEAVLSRFVGEIEQVPPAFSAIKVSGERLYRQARAGLPVEVPTRRVVVHALNLLAYDPPYLLLHVHCETGTYVRALARDIGRALGCGAYCHALRRTAVGRFCLGDAWTLEELAAEPLHERWPQIAFHPDIALRDRPAAILSEADVRKWYHGRPVGPYSAGTITGDLVRVYGAAGQFLGVAEGAADGTLKPVMVFTAEGEG